MFGLLSDPTRVNILNILLSKKEICVGNISEMANLSLSATSHQLRKLEFLGIVSKCRYGQEICYCLNKNSKLAGQLIKLIKTVK
jgi:DNA-binding transcriptional ArsR family regulator